MREIHSFLSRGLACLATALVIVSVLAMPTQGIRANDSGGPTPDPCTCNPLCPDWPGEDDCAGAYGCPAYCNGICGCSLVIQP